VKVEEIRALSNDEIAKALEEAYEEDFNLRFRLATRQLVNHREPVKVKRNIARIKTIMREREFALNEGA
jgi:large subunit ribosomal protein L29